jgi:hypothetical protein
MAELQRRSSGSGDEEMEGTMPLNDALPHEPYNRTDRDFAVTPTASMGEFPAYCSSGCNYWGGESETKSMGLPCMPPAGVPWGPFGGGGGGGAYAYSRETGVGDIPSKQLYRRSSFSCNDLQRMSTDEERRAALERGLVPRAPPSSAGAATRAAGRGGGGGAGVGQQQGAQRRGKNYSRDDGSATGTRRDPYHDAATGGGGGGSGGSGGLGGLGGLAVRTTSVPGLLGGFQRLNLTPGLVPGADLVGRPPPLPHPASQAAEDAFAAAAALDQEGGPDRPLRVLFCCHGSRGDVQPLVSLALGMKQKGGYEVAFWTVRPVDEFVKRQGIQCYVHDLDTDALMRRTQVKVNEGAAERLGKALGFFKAVTEVMLEPDIAPLIDAIPQAVLEAHQAYKPDLTITSHCMPAISCAEYLHIPVVYIALQPMYPTKEFPPWAFRSTNFEANMRWMNKPLGKLFMSIYENQTYLKGVKKCRQLANLPVRRFSDGTPV